MSEFHLVVARLPPPVSATITERRERKQIAAQLGPHADGRVGKTVHSSQMRTLQAALNYCATTGYPYRVTIDPDGGAVVELLDKLT